MSKQDDIGGIRKQRESEELRIKGRKKEREARGLAERR